jgi:hypothetical protein
MYKDKKCQYKQCDNIFTPTTGSQKYCSSCAIKSKQEKDRLRWRDRNRELNCYKEYTRLCKICGKEFKTFYKKKIYCGSEKCEAERIRLKNKNYHEKRDHDYMIGKGRSYYRKNKASILLKKAAVYRKNNKNVKRYKNKIHIHNIDYIRNYVEERGYQLLSKEYLNSKSKIKLKCPNGHTWKTTFHNFRDANSRGEIITGARCITCYLNNNYTSKPEQKIRDFFKEHHPNIKCLYNDRTVIGPKELDLYFPSNKVAVEVCGLYWHSENLGNTDRNYHYEKMVACFNNGVRLITVFEDEIYNKFDIVISRICQALGIIKHKVFARNCDVREISANEANGFFEKNHLQGKSNSVKAWGLFNNNKLIAACGVGNLLRKRISNKNVLELKRFCSLINYTVVGGANKLFKHVVMYAKKLGYDEIRSYCDMRYANIFNVVYDILGFKLLTLTKYTPHHFKSGIRYRNFSLRKIAVERESGKTEFELRKAQGYDRIWDCGHRTYVYRII